MALAQRRLARTLGTVQRASALFGPRDPLRAQMEAVLELAARAGPLDELVGASATLYSTSGDGEDSGEDEALDVFDAGDLAGLVAPRPLVLVAGREDPIFPFPGVEKAYAVAQRYYAEAGAPERLRLVIGEGAHRFYADDAWPVMKALMNQG